MAELEIEFQVREGSAAGVEAALKRGTVRRTRLRARYFDTPDEALARARLVLRLRQEGLSSAGLRTRPSIDCTTQLATLSPQTRAPCASSAKQR
ncbi:CYTH domain-containing protein [Sorangium sp. So ce124]|uniref:CYTH domain-containing protein n=1 Tax=Sorangium sp. So ce124 TaxID=3133280 RepID=UPI003F637012